MFCNLRSLLAASLLLPQVWALTIQKFDVEINVEIEKPSVPFELVEDFVDGITLAPIDDQNLEGIFAAEPVCTAFDPTGPNLHCDLLTRPCCTQCRCTNDGRIECNGAMNGSRKCTMCDAEKKRRGCSCRPANSPADKTLCKTVPGPAPPHPPPVAVEATVKTSRVDVEVPVAADQVSLTSEAELNPLVWTVRCPSSLYKRCEQCCGCGNGPARPLCSNRGDCAALYKGCVQAVAAGACTCANV